MMKSAVTAERWPYKVAAVFDSFNAARNAAESLYRSPKINNRRVDIVEPGDPMLSSKLEPEKQGIKRTLVRAHVNFGIAGLILGGIVAIGMSLAGIQAVAASPLYSMMAMAFIGGMVGLLVGGLFSIRPDHDPLINKARDAADRGQWMVLVHATDREQESSAKSQLEKLSDEVVTTI